MYVTSDEESAVRIGVYIDMSLARHRPVVAALLKSYLWVRCFAHGIENTCVYYMLLLCVWYVAAGRLARDRMACFWIFWNARTDQFSKLIFWENWEVIEESVKSQGDYRTYACSLSTQRLFQNDQPMNWAMYFLHSAFFFWKFWLDCRDMNMNDTLATEQQYRSRDETVNEKVWIGFSIRKLIFNFLST